MALLSGQNYPHIYVYDQHWKGGVFVSTVLAKKVQSGYACALNNERMGCAAPRRPAFGREPAAGGLRDVQDRLRALRGTLGYRRFAARVGAKPNSVRRYELGMARVPLDYVQAVCRAFNVSADWLIFGIEAPAGLADAAVRAIREGSLQATRSAIVAGERVRIVCVPVLNRVPAGAPAEMLDDMPVGFGLEGFIRVPDPGDPNAYALRAWGDSMEPLIHDGERFVVSPRRAHGFSAGVAVLRLRSRGGEVCVKHVRVRGDRVEVIPVNLRYPGMVLAAEEVEVLGRVTMVAGEG